MAYTWTDGELITAEKLNNTGGGVLVVKGTYNAGTAETTLNKTFKEISDAYLDGNVIVVVDEFGQAFVSTVNKNALSIIVVALGSNDDLRYTAETEDSYPVATSGSSPK